jgi:hypothetical protein
MNKTALLMYKNCTVRERKTRFVIITEISILGIVWEISQNIPVFTSSNIKSGVNYFVTLLRQFFSIPISQN